MSVNVSKCSGWDGRVNELRDNEQGCDCKQSGAGGSLGRLQQDQQAVQKGQTSHQPNPGAPRRAVPRARPQGGVLLLQRFTFYASRFTHLQNEAGELFQHPASLCF